MIVAFPAGGPIDIVAHMLAPKLGENLGQSVTVDNRAGANELIGTEHVVRSAPDGYTLYLACASAIAISPALMAKVLFDALRDLAGMSLVTRTPGLLVVHLLVPAQTVRDLVALAKSRPGRFNMTSTSSGGLPHLALALFKSAANIGLLRVPYKGAAPAACDLVAGHVHGMFADLPVLHPRVVTGKLRAPVVASPARVALLPDLPTMSEHGLPAVEAVNWYGLLVPAKTSR